MGLLFDPDAFSSIPVQDITRLMNKVGWLWLNREVITHERLAENLSGFCKRRVGNYRIIYTYDINADEMIIHLVGTRDSIYKDASKRFR